MKLTENVYSVESLLYVRSMITKYAHVWFRALDKNHMPSHRMISWVDYYDNARSVSPEVWKAYCSVNNSVIYHNAGDIMA